MVLTGASFYVHLFFLLTLLVQEGHGQTATELRACCGTNCVTYESPVQMFGLQCCADTVINSYDQICCNGTAAARQVGNRFYDRCCGSSPLAYDQTCCSDQIFNGADLLCCGAVAHDRFDATRRCCGDVLHTVETGAQVGCCGTQIWDNGLTQTCCGNQVYTRSSSQGCCVTYRPPSTPETTPIEAAGFDRNTQLCCNQVYDKTEFDTCCYVRQAAQQGQQTTPEWIPTAYNSNTQCCTYSGVTAKQGDSC